MTGRRADGYHLLDSTVVFASVGDTLAVSPDHHLSLRIDGPFAGALADDRGMAADDNLVLRAARLLAHAGGGIPHGALHLDTLGHCRPGAGADRQRARPGAATTPCRADPPCRGDRVATAPGRR
ncbi:MAG: 4-(cytidine 5'-diphospho)-2-C-methyl-D-erythritol kinase, partial [Azospirillaceae bacterium]